MADDAYSDGIHIIAEPQDKDGKSFDIIAVHGLGGDYRKTWTSDTGFNCLEQSLAIVFSSCTILSYNCSTLLQDLQKDNDEAEHFLSEILEYRRTKNRSHIPIVFIAYSYGGILVKQAFIRSHPSRSTLTSHQQFHDSIYGVVFLGTPHKHPTPTNIDNLWRLLEHRCDDTLNGSVGDLKALIETTSTTNDEYFRFGGEDVPTVCFYEAQTVWIGIEEMHIVPKDQALLRSRPTDGGNLVADHFNLPKFEGVTDRNLKKFMNSLRTLMQIVSDSAPRSQTAKAATREGLRLLSLDGGGVKGIFTILVLQRILYEVQKLEEFPGRRQPCEYFDLIGGTSTGGLLAIMLGRLQMDIRSCIETYRDLSLGIFQRNDWIPFKQFAEAILGQPWFSGARLKEAICATVDRHINDNERESMRAAGLSAEDIRFLSIESQQTRCFVCAIPEGQHEAEIIRSYHPHPRRGRDTSSYKIWQAARATSAAPMYFPAMEIQGTTYFDGGLEANNPILNVIDEAKAEFSNVPIAVIISIGTGKGKWIDPHGLHVVHSVLGRATNTEHQHDRIMTRPEFEDLRGGYFRFQEEDALGEIDLADTSKLDDIEKLAQEYLSRPSVEEKILNCARRLART